MEILTIELDVEPIGVIPIFLKKWGRGPKVLLVHGWLDTSQKWKHLGEHLAPNYEVWTLGLPGFGETPAIPPQHTTLETYAGILARLINHLTEWEGLSGLVGHSMGGLISLLAIQSHPHLARQAIICGAPVAGVGYLKPLTDHESLVIKGLTAIQSFPINLRTRVIKLINLITLRSWRALKSEGRTLQDVHPNTAAVLLKQVCACNLLDQLKPTPVNVLVIRGEHDPLVDCATAEKLAEKLNGSFYEFQGSRHSPMTEQPDHFHRVVSRFLDKGYKT